MKFDLYNILLLCSSFSAGNIGLYYLIQALRGRKRFYLPLSLLIVSLCILFAFFELNALYLKYPHLTWVTGPLLFAIGPLFYLQVKTKLSRYDVLHFWLVPLIYIRLLPFYIKSKTEKIEILQEYFALPGATLRDFRLYLYVLHIAIYTILGYLVLRKRHIEIGHSESDFTQLLKNKRFQVLYLLIALFALVNCSSYFFFDNFGLKGNSAFAYTLLLFVMLILLAQLYLTTVGLDSINMQNSKSLTKDEKERSLKKETHHKSIIERIDKHMNTEKLYKNQDLKLADVANSIDLSLHEISAAINSQKEMNFFDYVNRFRIEELKITLLSNENENLTLFAIGEKAGFKSNSSFYRVFKKHIGLTPKQYIKKYSENP
ncbi:helix-turn-helix domain-containing protein [Psychroserpens luteolus]|uniref:helix-turn-helix domain-containing protein n=1 Tax=Psychroserpens luteolus TaxID=2855840 RepID=UPI001E33EDC9|nr:helix-turn-helix domain-containing protein [Psychroserpens luteolus]MCD2260191.1 helix-turn-helix domain-containing protein [Psychroserpens luteolus]